MSIDLSTVLILLTPFQLDQLSKIQDQYGIEFNRVDIFYSEIVSRERIEKELKFKTVNWIKLPPITANFSKILKSPFKEIPRHRRYISNLKKIISDELHLEIKIEEVWIGTEKDIFTQLLIDHVDRQAKDFKLIAFEEGLGFYSERTKKDLFKKRIYPLITPLIFGFKYEYIVSLGTFDRINELYARFPEDIPYRSNSTIYHKIEAASKREPHPPKKDILFIGAPLSEAKVCSLEKEKELLTHIFKAIDGMRLTTDIKGHPREIIKKYYDFKSKEIQVLDHRLSAEKLDYFNYSCVINLGSSVILDLYQCNFPLDRIITLNMGVNFQSLTHKLFEQGKHGKLFSENLKDEITDYLHVLFP